MNPFEDLRAALSAGVDSLSSELVRSDPGRARRTGNPEVIYAARKSMGQILSAVADLIEVNGRVVLSQVPERMAADLQMNLPSDQRLEMSELCPSGVVIRAGAKKPQTGGRIAVITAGSSDVPVASEAALIAYEMGCEIRSTWDVGVAGIHRLVRPLEQMVAWDADVFVVAAGMDGILPAIVSGLVSQPVIGLPVSTGYGFGGQGVGAMTTMLQTCSPGLAVVNIDNGIGAGITAGRIANRAAINRV